MNKLSVQEVECKLNGISDFELSKPGRNKGSRGIILEEKLGISNGFELKDLIDGELKSFTIGESIAVTMLNHCLSEIINDGVEFKNSKVYEKLKQIVYVAFTRTNVFVKSKTINVENSPFLYGKLEEDFNHICSEIKKAYLNGKVLRTINGSNKLLQIRTKASKSTNGSYTPLRFGGVTLKDKGMAFYLRSSFGKEILDTEIIL
jgi:DNA mismatch repair protein MutH